MSESGDLGSQWGLPFDQAAKQELFDQLEKSYISGVTFSGGDPLYPGNRMEITALAKEIREKFPEKTIWMYTGSLWETVKSYEVMKYVDVLVDGEYECRQTRHAASLERQLQPAGDRCAGFSPQRTGSIAQQLKMRRINR